MSEYVKKYARKQALLIANLFKVFDSFEDGFNEMIKLVPSTKQYIGESPIYESAIKSILDSIASDVPSIATNSNYPNCKAISIDAKEVGYKTEGTMSFGWKIIINHTTSKIQYKFRVTFRELNRFSNDNYKTIKSLKNEDWEKDIDERWGRFFSKLEHRSSFRPYYQKNKDVIDQNVPESDEPESIE